MDMIQLGFKEDDGSVSLRNEGGKIFFEMNPDSYENRELRMKDGALLFDGYSIWFHNNGEIFRELGDFAISLQVAPQGYSAHGDGLFSLYDQEAQEGFYIQLKKHGKLEVGFGDGRFTLKFQSICADAVKYAWNVVTVVYRQTEGWCDLYVNGVFSNRKQFRRHTPLKWPKGEAFFGKYVDRKYFQENTKAGILYGYLRDVRIHTRSLSAQEILDYHSTCRVGEIVEKAFLDRGIFKRDLQRPGYHLIAPGKWMNEPHGPLWFQGYYHMFYQANPHGPVWDNIQWGHLISRDMVHWEDMPLALETEDNGLDPDGCWSGSTLVDKEGCPRIFYTAGNDSKFPNQSVAMAAARIDAEKRLPEWIKYPVPVVTQKEGWMGEFRDPFAWLEDDTYFMLVGTGDAGNGGGNAILFTSEDMLNWKSHGFLLRYDYEKNQEVGHVWELPVLLPLRDESGEIVCHIFLMCACQIENEVVETYGFLGRWDHRECKFEKFHEKPLLLDLGNGTFTGPSGFVTPDKRTVVFTIAQGKRDGKDAYHAGWAHNGGLPVELSICGGELRIRPIRELGSLKKKCLLELKNVSLEEANGQLARFKGNSLWMKLTLDCRNVSLETLCDDKKRTVYYEKETGRFGAVDEAGKQIGKCRGELDHVMIGSEPVCLEYFLDYSMIEVYLNERKSITLRNYFEGVRSVRLTGDDCVVSHLELWEMDSAYDTQNN